MKRITILLVLTVVGFTISTSAIVTANQYCYSGDTIRAQKTRHASLTSYQFRKGKAGNYSHIEGCTPQQFWLASRHGTRLPSTKLMTTFNDTFSAIQEEILSSATSQLCPGDLELLRQWKWDSNITIDDDQYLVDQGWDDLKLLAESYKAAYPSLLPAPYSPDRYFFQHTERQRTYASYHAFADGLFGDGAHKSMPSALPNGTDYLLKPYEYCDTWQALQDDPAETEADRFKATPLYLQMIDDINTRLGTEIPAKQIREMYDLCRYEQAWYIHAPSAWCAVFSPAHIEIMEYDEDLKYYYKSGYGHEDINGRVTCDLVADFIHRLDGNDNRSTAYFSHSSLLQLMFVALGVYRDVSDLTADTFEKFSENREWQASVIGPLTTNLAIVKYDCPLDTQNREKALFLHNERPMPLDWCEDGLCNWTEVKERYSFFTNDSCRNIYCLGDNSTFSQKISRTPTVVLLNNNH